MNKNNFFKTLGLAALGVAMVACGSSGDGATPNMTLGITSVTPGAAKPSFVSNVMGEAAKLFSVNEAVANNNAGTCADPTTGAFLSFLDGGGTGPDKIWVYKAYAILDEFEFEHVNSSSSSDSIDDETQWVIDLLDNDDNVDNQVPLNVPDGFVAKSVKFKIQRLEDDQLNLLKGVTDQSAFLASIGFGTTGQAQRVRPSIYLKGDIQSGGNCHTFQFVSDARFRTTVPFGSGTLDTSSVKGILQFDIKEAFKTSGATAANLSAEIGAQLGGSKALPSGDYLDGRTKDPDTGSSDAVKWAKALTASWEVFTQDLTSSSTLDASATQITVPGNNPGSDDNPSASDLDNPV